MSSIEQPRLILVTGANKGIGFEIVKKLVQDSPSNSTTILLGSRDLKRGQDAYSQLNSPFNVHVIELDTSSQESINHAINEIKEKYGGQLDVVINNAGISSTEITVDIARELFKTNYYGVKTLNECLFPLMRQNGRIVNVSSRTGTVILQEASQALQEKYTSPILTIDQLDQLVEDFISAIETNNVENIGYNLKSTFLVYGVTKAALNSLAQIQARQWSNNKNLLVVNATPGLCSTDMTENTPKGRSPELGANSILYLVNTDRNQLENGGFYRDGEQLPLVNQRVR